MELNVTEISSMDAKETNMKTKENNITVKTANMIFVKNAIKFLEIRLISTN
jgi:hypothetical protein